MALLKFGATKDGRKPNPLVELHPGFSDGEKQASPYLRLVKFALRTDGTKGVSPDPAKTGGKGGKFTVSVDNTDYLVSVLEGYACGRGISPAALAASLELSDEVRPMPEAETRETLTPEQASDAS